MQTKPINPLITLKPCERKYCSDMGDISSGITEGNPHEWNTDIRQYKSHSTSDLLEDSGWMLECFSQSSVEQNYISIHGKSPAALRAQWPVLTTYASLTIKAEYQSWDYSDQIKPHTQQTQTHRNEWKHW